jgi:arginine N-succinyltransferase
MFLIRQAKQDDVPTLSKLARMVYFINLPPDERIIAEKVQHSQRCFARAASVASTPGSRRSGESPDGQTATTSSKVTGTRKHRRGPAGHGGFVAIEQDSELFMFVVEDTESGTVVGTSQVRSHQGGPGNPNWSFKISEKSFRSESLGWGTTHKTGQLYGDETGPTEIGGLILQPYLRGNPARPGRLVSFVRFHFMGLNRPVFSDRIIAEMMPPVTPEGDNVFWDAFGRKFIPVKYAEADRFCQHNRKFISELLPKEEIYLTLFPLEVQNTVGIVSRETIPARRMLESLGFAYRGFVDPFDGGPHLEAATDAVPLINQTTRATLGKATATDRCTAPAIVSYLSADGEFRAIETMIERTGTDGNGPVRLMRHAMESLEAAAGVQVGITPMEAWHRSGEPKAETDRRQTSPPAKKKARPRKRVGA